MSKRWLPFAIGAVAGALLTYALAPVVSEDSDGAGERAIGSASTRAAFDPRGSEGIADVPSVPAAADPAVASLAALAEADPAAAFRDAAALRDLGERRRALMLVGEVWARTDPRTALAQSATLPFEARADYLASVTAEWANLDAENFLAYAEQAGNLEELTGGLELLIASDPARVFEIAARLPDVGSAGRNPVRMAAIRALAERDSAAAMRIVEPMPSGPEYDVMSSLVLPRYAQQYPDLALAWLDARRTPSVGERLAVIQGIALADFDHAFEFAADEPPMSASLMDSALTEAVIRDAEHTLRVASTLLERDGNRADQLLERVMSAWVVRDPERAVEWMIERSSAMDPRLARATAQSLASRDLESALSYLDRLPATLRDTWIMQVAGPYAERDPAAALEWVARYHGQSSYEDAHAQVVMQAAESTPKLVAEMLEGFTPALKAAAAPQVASAWAAQDPEAAAEWVLDLGGPGSFPDAVDAVVVRWAQRDPDAASDWAIALPRGETRDNALWRLIVRSYGTRLDPRPLLDEIDSDELRRTAASMAVSRLRAIDPDDARELLSRLIDDPALGPWAREELESLADRGR